MKRVYLCPYPDEEEQNDRLVSELYLKENSWRLDTYQNKISG